ncbi:TusE/DsrC/DsvC family sulfur relay protein [Rheinheimera baltica]|uniref:Sulfurtransferase n=1 Tax=Rheinheimera baltica TaxID=67576 RepID=A0ABT9HW86_9GAMM|nr:TusE/DsrC/DsvC family sulfur relay protein [Rheinheimera baltica]MDP5135366.1 TusE/DsrC/DsvC family sulfur relay protein [Rheinheimera baltica]MDP5144562.1 TusE/DsrC/DsvC family sulfur relay protein [Rheinheimera baltica]MDP5149169.1 TusE/DsrC/DsvC family sulfur relay protein [Rheinheimera baltica]MDP5191505.1 TusE/DsrC/DsvC family sulfur relay protein [Rheinheimera baltica]
MAELMIDNANLVLDKHGYLANLTDWNIQVAEHFALLEQINLTDAHWEVVHFVRDFYLEFNTSPAMRILVKAMAQKLGAEKGNSKYLFQLFPQGPAKQATRIAGLPKPAKCL